MTGKPGSAFSRIGLSFFVLLLVQQVIASTVVIAVGAAAPQLMEAGWFMWVVSYVPLYLIAFPIFLLMMKRVPNTLDVAEMSEKKTVSAGQMLLLIPVCLCIVYIFNLLAVLLSTLVETAFGSGITNPLETVVMGSDAIINLIVVVLIAPVMEEIIFRGILYKKLAAYGSKVFILFSSFIFMLYHVNIYQMGYAFALGVILAALTWYTGSIRSSIILHMAVNFIGGGMSSVLLAYFGEGAATVWGMIFLALAVAGLVILIVWLKKNRGLLKFEQGVIPSPGAKSILLNSGMVLLMILFIVLLVIVMASSGTAVTDVV